MAVGINIVTGFDGKGVEKAIKEFGKLQTEADKTKFVISKAALPAAAALAGVAAAAGLATKAAIEDQAEQAALAQTLRQATGATNQQIEAVEKQISAMMQVSTFSDGELRPALGNLVQATQDVSRAQQLMTLAMDLSAATGVPLITVTDALAKAENGQMKALASLAPVVRENVKEGQSLNATYDQLTSVFGGAALAQTKTAAGQLQQFKNQVAELAEAMGAVLIPIVETILPIMVRLANFAENNRFVIIGLAGGVALFSTALITANAYIKLTTLQMKLLKKGAEDANTALVGAGNAMGLFGKGLKTAGQIMATVALAETIFQIGNAASGAERKIDTASKRIIISLGNMQSAAAGDTTAIINDFTKLASEINSKLKMSDVFGDFGREFQLIIGGAKVDIEDFDEAFKQVMESSPDAAARLIAALKAQLAITDPTSRAYQDLADAVSRYEKQLNLANAAQNALNGGFQGVVSFAKSGAFVKLANQQIRENWARQQSVDSLEKWNDKAKQTYAAAQKVAAAQTTVKEKLDNYRSALESSVDATKSLKDAQTSLTDAKQRVVDAFQGIANAQRSVEKASQDVADAIKGVADAQAKTSSARLAYKRSIDDTAKAQVKLSKATTEVAKAQKAFDEALRGYGSSSKQGKEATRRLADAQQDVERSAYDLEKATFAISDAEAELALVRADEESTPQAIREAEIALAEAKLALIDAQERQVDSQDEVTEAADHYDQMLNGVKETSTLYKDLLEDLNRAKEAEQQAIEAVTAARENEVEALDAIQEALDGEAEAAQRVEDAKWNLAAAERDLEKAKRDHAKAIQEVADATLNEARAVLDLAQAQKELNTARKQAPSAGVARIDKQFEAITAQLADVKAQTQSSQANTSDSLYGLGDLGGLMMLASGGIVTRPTAAIVGERGPEAVIPLSSPRGLAGIGGTVNITVNAGMGANGADIGKQVVNALRDYERRNGAIPITVS